MNLSTTCLPLRLISSSSSSIPLLILHFGAWIEMESKGEKPLPSPPFAVCCMCGDHGLPAELFRCKLCFLRSQHKYCSNLYPKAESYEACNWCLREEAAKPPAAGNRSSPRSSSSNTTSSSSNGSSGSGSGGSGNKLHRSGHLSHINKPVKKARPPERSPPARQVVKSKVRRYKLLEEVSS